MPAEDSPARASVAEVAVDVNELRAGLRTNSEFFIRFFLPEETDELGVPEFHKEIFTLMVSAAAQYCVFAISRAHAKTTLAKLAALYYILFTDYTFIVYLGATSKIAIPCVNDIVDFMMTDNFRAVFGAVEFQRRREGDGDYIIHIPSLQKTIILKALAVGQRMRGVNEKHRRPQLAIGDDLEDYDTKASDALSFTKIRKWFYAVFLKALDRRKHKVIQLGNIVATQTLLQLHCESPRWFSRLYGAIKADGTVLWPGYWDLPDLIADYQEYERQGLADLWFAEMMNMPVAKGGAIIEATEITYRPPRTPESVKYGFITLDLAISKETWAHKTVLAVHMWIEEEAIWQVVESEWWIGIDPVVLYREVRRYTDKWNIRVVGIEDVAYQASLKYVFGHLARLDGFIQDEFLFVPIPGSSVRKAQRIISWAAMLKQTPTHPATYAVTYGDFMVTQQLLKYSPLARENDDDIVDCYAYGPFMFARYMTEIMASRRLPHQVVVSQSLDKYAEV